MAGRSDRFAGLVLFATAMAVLPGRAWGAQGDAGAAQLLFDEAKGLRDRGQWDEACDKFRASMKLDPALGPLLNIAACHEHEGRIASALNDYERARVMNRATPEADRREQVARHIDQAVHALRPRLPMLSIGVSERPPGLVVTRGDVDIPLEALDIPLPVDPGPVKVQARAEGFRGDASVILREGEAGRVVVQLARVAAASAPLPPQGGQIDGAAADEPTVWPWAVGGVGLALGLAGVGFGIWYEVTVGEIRDHCGDDFEHCQPDPVDYVPTDDNKAKNTSAALTAVFGVTGGAAIVTAIIALAVDAAAEDDGAKSGVSWVPGPGQVGIGVAVPL